MNKLIGDIQTNFLDMSSRLISVLQKIQQLDKANKELIVDKNIEIIKIYGKSFPDAVRIFGYENFYSRADEIMKVIHMISRENLRMHIAELDKAINNMIMIADRIMSERKGKQKVCACCGNKVYYKPLSSYYDQMEKKYGTKKYSSETINTDEYQCPSCFASDRDRLIISFMKKLNLDKGTKKETLLQIAPSEAIEHWIHRECHSLVSHTTDLMMEGVTFQADIQNMSGIENESYDYIICSHVLEHVQDDKKAIRELYRILKKDGFCLFLVPVALDLEKIDEEWGLTEEENWKRFGQGDHCRRYNKEGITERLKEAGFQVWNLGKEYFGKEVFYENGLTDTSVLYVLTKQKSDLSGLVDAKKRYRNIAGDSMPLVSVILSAYNHEKYVAQTIQSVLDQTYRNYEFLVADDCSTDDTVKEILKFEDTIEQIHLFDDNAGGRLPYLSRQAKGKYIAVINSDDRWEKDKLEQQVAYLENHTDCAACFTGGKCVDENDEALNFDIFLMDNMKKEDWMFYFFLNGNCLAHPSVLIHRDIYCELVESEISLFRQLPDYWMWVKLVQNHEIHIIEKELITFKFHEKGINQNTSARTIENEVRYYNEDAYLWYDTIKKMDNNYFIKAFRHILKDKEVNKERDIMCEKFLALKDSVKPQYRMAALFYIYEIYYMPDIADTLKNKYQTDLKDIYQLSGSIVIMDKNQIR